MRIRRLSEGTINRIAAGEVIERPASAVKELVENAIDAGASQVDVVFRGGGKSLIRVTDNGFGMSSEELVLAVERHATSKLREDDLTNINTMGFRGEALPSIGSVARLSISSRAAGQQDAFALDVEGGRVSGVRPSNLKIGSEVEIRDLFFATPARLKFLKTDRSETAEALDVLRRIAMANPAIGFSFASEDRRWLDVPADDSRTQRLHRILGEDILSNTVEINHAGEDLIIQGLAGLPTAARGQGTLQFAFVNGRPVRDKLVSGAIRGAYADVLPPGRFPVVAIFITCAPNRVDVNVHPAKSEVRFRDPGFVRGLLVSAIRRALASQSLQRDTTIAASTMQAFRPASFTQHTDHFRETVQSAFEMTMPPVMAPQASHEPAVDYPLGVARAQIHENYIVAQTAKGMILVDQHAAHERIVYERLKRERTGRGIITQPLLVPQVIDVDGNTFSTVLALQDDLANAGLVVDGFGDTSLVVREVPAAMATANFKTLLEAVADQANEKGSSAATTIEEKTNQLLSTFACHHSVRSGRVLRVEEMNALLREMEITPNAGQCNHGRPTFIELPLGDIERLFGRS